MYCILDALYEKTVWPHRMNNQGMYCILVALHELNVNVLHFGCTTGVEFVIVLVVL
jgi:hypothetical protein